MKFVKALVVASLLLAAMLAIPGNINRHILRSNTGHQGVQLAALATDPGDDIVILGEGSKSPLPR